MRFLEDLAVRFLERRGALTKDRCGSFGGAKQHTTMPVVRVCTKWRYHTDSHAYEWETVDPW